MNELLRDFLTEAHENLDVIDVELVRFEREPNNADLLSRIFRLVHTIKGTCGFLGLPRLETLTHAAETLMGKFREGLPVTPDAVSLILSVIDRIKEILAELDRSENEPGGDDDDLIRELERRAFGGELPGDGQTVGTLVYQVLERPLRAGEVSLDDLEQAFRDAPGPDGTEPAEEDRRAHIERREEERRDPTPRAQTLRVQVDTLESLMTMVSELVLTRNQLLEIMRRSEDSDLNAPFQRLSNITGELQEGVMKTRMQPIGNAWAKLPRVVRDLSAELGKKIELTTSGEETELDRQLLEHIKDPLTHMVRNSADHGIEKPEERLAAGKRETGTIKLSAFHEGGLVIVEITDDGRGLDARKIRERAIALGLVGEAEAETLSDSQIYRLILAPGFSTASEVTSISGRGVGMDVVKSNIDQIGGALEIKSVPGKSTTLRIKIPLTLAIVSALIVEAEAERFAIPQIAVVELVRVGGDAEHRIERIKNAAVLRLRDQLVPVEYLSTLLKLPRPETPRPEHFVVMMQVGGRRFGIVVDQVVQTEEIVVKPLSPRLRQIELFSGNTILGDGSVIMILDPNGVSAVVGGNAETPVAHETPIERASAENADMSVPLLVFRAGSREPKAVPISLVTRIEEIEATAIERSNGRHMVQYRGGLMPLLPVNDDVKVRSEGTQPLLVFVDRAHSMGLIVDEIVDIVENRLDIRVGSKTPGVLGSAVIDGHATEIVDVAHYMPLAFEDWLHRSQTTLEEYTRRVMLVDDSAFFRNMLSPVLMAAGYEVKALASGREALAVLENDNKFDYVICDIEMPEMNGFELAERLRANPRTAGLRLIALSSLHSPAAVDRGREAGFTHYIAKFDRGGLIAILKEPLLKWARAA
ncbi:MAG TPA: hybrid sensor histidine kinase/response regulator [Xanthobacteraceae bacterium]|nr:hybrid sensor histidine kinase/response regulator [Xanthobacteraceae bacterium]